MLVSQFLQDSAERFPDKVALICDDQYLTYGRIQELTDRIAAGLCESGIQRGDRIAVWLPNSVKAVLAIFGILKVGAVFTVIHPTTKRDKLIHILNNCAARGLFFPERHGSEIPHLLQAVPSLQLAVVCERAKGGQTPCARQIVRFSELLEMQSATHLPCKSIDVDLACLIYTSGSTGEPKGVMSTHANISFVASSIIQFLENTPKDIIINIMPLSFDYGLYQLLMAFKFSGTLVLERSFAFPTTILNRISEERVTGLPGVPTIFAMMLQMDLDRFDLSSIRYLTNTAAALPVEHIKQLRAALPWARLYSMYGLTECKRALYLPPQELDRRPGSVGIAIPGTEAWIEDESGNRLGPKEVGQLVIRGSHVMQGYWGDPQESAKRYRSGDYPGDRLLYTGDLFRMDREGFFYFVARTDEIIKSRGEKIAPKEVENVLYRLPGVAEAAVVGVPDKLLGQAIKAIVVPSRHHQLTKKKVLRHCARHLEIYMVPQYVELVSSLPKTLSGKIQKSALE